MNSGFGEVDGGFRGIEGVKLVPVGVRLGRARVGQVCLADTLGPRARTRQDSRRERHLEGAVQRAQTRVFAKLGPGQICQHSCNLKKAINTQKR